MKCNDILSVVARSDKISVKSDNARPSVDCTNISVTYEKCHWIRISINYTQTRTPTTY